jgi:hypothetical protein
MNTTPRLNEKQLLQAKALFDELEKRIKRLSKSNSKLVFAYRRKLRKWLEYEERGTPTYRRKLKEIMWERRQGLCAICGKKMPKKEVELDRRDPVKGYQIKNVRLVHHKCHREDQKSKRFA